MTPKEYRESRRKTTSQQINLLLEKAAESFLEGKKSITLKVSYISEEFFNELRKTAYDEWNFDVRKRAFGRVEIFSGIIYEYPV